MQTKNTICSVLKDQFVSGLWVFVVFKSRYNWFTLKSEILAYNAHDESLQNNCRHVLIFLHY